MIITEGVDMGHRETRIYSLVTKHLLKRNEGYDSRLAASSKGATSSTSGTYSCSCPTTMTYLELVNVTTYALPWPLRVGDFRTNIRLVVSQGKFPICMT